MEYDLVCRGSNTCIIDEKPGSYNAENDFVYTCSITLNNQFKNASADGFAVRKNAPIQVYANDTADFTWNTGIYTYEQVMEIQPENDVVIAFKKCVSEKPYCKYIFVQVY